MLYDGNNLISARIDEKSVEIEIIEELLELNRPHRFGGLTSHAGTAFNAYLAIKEKYDVENIEADEEIFPKWKEGLIY